MQLSLETIDLTLTDDHRATINSGPGVRPFIIMYAQLAITVLYDLGMTRSPIEEQYVTASFKVWGGRPPHTKTRTMAERRSILALWFMTSMFVPSSEPILMNVVLLTIWD